MREETLNVLREIQSEIFEQTRPYLLSSPGGAYSAGEYSGLMKASSLIHKHIAEAGGYDFKELAKPPKDCLSREDVEKFEQQMAELTSLPEDHPIKMKFRKQMAKVRSFESLEKIMFPDA